MILEVLTAELTNAFKARDMDKVISLRYLLSIIKEKEVDLRGQGQSITDEDVIGVLKSQLKKRHKTLESFQERGHSKLIDREKYDIEMLGNYLTQFSS